MKKKYFLFFILPVLILMLCSFKETDDFFRYEITEDNEAHIIAFVGESFSNNIEIPEEIEGYKVTTIKEGAFYNNPYIKKIIIPSSVKVIEGSAFAYCEELENIVFKNGDSKIIISEFAFEMCASLKSIEFSNRETYIDDYAFENCKMLGKVYFPKNITHIGYLAFRGCESIIFDCKDCPVAQSYANEHKIPTDFLMSDDFMLIITLSISIIVFIIVLIIYKMIKKQKKTKNK